MFAEWVQLLRGDGRVGGFWDSFANLSLSHHVALLVKRNTCNPQVETAKPRIDRSTSGLEQGRAVQ